MAVVADGSPIVWMLVEVVVSLFSAWRGRSPALFAFGGIASNSLRRGCAVEVPIRHRMRDQGRRGCPDRRRFVVCARCPCSPGVSREPAWLWRTQTKCHGNCHTPLGRGGDATTCPRETETVHCDGKRGAESRCSGIGSMRISFRGCLARGQAQHCLAYVVGRSCCGSGHRASDRLGRPRSKARQTVRLSLKNATNALTIETRTKA